MENSGFDSVIITVVLAAAMFISAYMIGFSFIKDIDALNKQISVENAQTSDIINKFGKSSE